MARSTNKLGPGTFLLSFSKTQIDFTFLFEKTVFGNGGQSIEAKLMNTLLISVLSSKWIRLTRKRYDCTFSCLFQTKFWKPEVLLRFF